MPYRDRGEAKAARRRYYLANRDYLRGLQADRRAADPEAIRQYRSDHREEIARQVSRASARRRAYVAGIKAAPCVDCGGTFPPECMDFDHVRGEKLKDVSKMLLWATERLHEELSKCDLVCANCHRIRTHQRRKDAAIQARAKEAIA